MELLRHMSGRGYPGDYLLARVKGRRRYLVGDWRVLLTATEPLAIIAATPYRQGAVPGTDEELWGGLLREFDWLYAQMEEGMRSIFAPLFLYFELRTVVLCLRQRLAGDERSFATLLQWSLLSPQVQKLLQAERDIPDTIYGLSTLFVRLAEPFKVLRQAYREQGVSGLEERLTTIYLEHVVETRLHPVIGEFFRRLIDLRNTITLAKQRRWGITVPPPFIRGGTINETLFRKAAEDGDITAAETILRRQALAKADLATGNLESLLLSRFTRLLRKWGREPAGVGCILDYLWRSAMEARNLSLLVHGVEVERDLLGGELIL